MPNPMASRVPPTCTVTGPRISIEPNLVILRPGLMPMALRRPTNPAPPSTPTTRPLWPGYICLKLTCFITVIFHLFYGRMMSPLSQSTTSLTVAGDIYFHFTNIKVFHFPDFLLQVTGQWITEFDHPATAKAHQMMVFPGWLRLIVVMAFPEMQLIHHIQLFQHLKGAINRGKAEARLLLTGTTEYLIGIEMPPPLPDNVHDQGALMGKSLPRFIQFPAVSAHLTIVQNL
jgi:hypothetical protein